MSIYKEIIIHLFKTLLIILNLWFQLTIQARDMGTPELNSNQNARVTVQVARNRNDPKFEGMPFNFKINRNADVNSVIGQVAARDNDQQVSEIIAFLFDLYKKSLSNVWK